MFQSLMSSLSSGFRNSITDYTDIEAPYIHNKHDNIFITKDGGFMSMMDIDGSFLHVGDDKFYEIIQSLKADLSKKLEAEGYRLEFTFIRDPEKTKKFINANLNPIRKSVKRLHLDFEAILDERESILSNFLIYEKCYLTVKSYPKLFQGKEAKRAFSKRTQDAKGNSVKPGIYAQSPFVALEDLFAKHLSFTEGLISLLADHFKVTSLNHRQAMKSIKEEIERYSTGDDWMPSLLGDKVKPKILEEVDIEADISNLLNPDLTQQLFSRKPEISDEDWTVVKQDGVYYAPLIVDSAQSQPATFNDLFAKIPKETPYRLTISIDSGHENIKSKISRKKSFASFLSFSNSTNKLIKDACEQLISDAVNNTLVSVQISACTWGKTYSDCTFNKNRLSQALQSWGGLDVIDESGDAIEAWINTMPAISGKKIATPIALPLDELLYMLPLSRTASPYDIGTLMYNTVDGKPYPIDFCSSQQEFSAEITFAGPGSGKSLKLLASNMALLCKPGITKIPKIKMVDIGFTAVGFVEMIRDSLPDEMKYLAQSITLENTSKFAINPFYTPLGSRKPLAVSLSDQGKMLELILTPANEKNGVPRMSELSSALVEQLYEEFSDKNNPKAYICGIDDSVDEELFNLGFDISYKRTWWEVVDYLFDNGLIDKASRAQRYAMPLLSDLLSVIKSYTITSVFGEAVMQSGELLLEFASQMAISALQDYPILTQPTVVDTSSARIFAVDLQNVAPKGDGKNAKQTTIMYLLARAICMSDLYYRKEMLEEVNPKYRDYFTKYIEEESGIPKKISYDEFHRTEGIKSARDLIEADIREGRKYAISVSLLSQSASDFTKTMIEFATDIYILSIPVSKLGRKSITETFAPSDDTWNHALRNVRRPGKQGSSMIYMGTTSKTPKGIEQILRLKLGSKEIWAYSTTPNDCQLRRALSSTIGLSKTLNILGSEFPSGSATEYIEAYQLRMLEAANDTNESAIDRIKNDLILKYKDAA